MGGVWRFGRGNFGLHYIDALALQNFGVAHKRVDYHNADGIIWEVLPGCEVDP